jgi:tetratricopeptide (TPR) repeat protein
MKNLPRTSQITQIGVLVVLLASSGFAQTSPEANLRAGIEAYQAGQLENAIVLVRRAHRADPENPQARLYLGFFLYEKTRDSIEAQRLMESVADRFPANTDLQLRLLDSYLRTKNQTRTGQLLDRLRHKMSADPRFAFNVLYTLVHHADYDRAKAEIDRVSRELQGEISFLGALIELGSGQTEAGHKLLQNATRLGFPAADSRQILTAAEAYFQLRDFPAAAAAYESFLKHNPDTDPVHRFKLGLSYYAYGDFARALDHMLAVKRTAPQTPEVDLYAGGILIELKKTEEARPHLQAALVQDPRSHKAMAKLAYLEYLAGNDEQCRAWLAKAQAIDPDWFETHMVYGLLYNRAGDYEAAIRSLEACLKGEPDYPKAHFQLSLAYRRLGNEEKANHHMKTYEALQNAATTRSKEALGLSDRPPK